MLDLHDDRRGGRTLFLARTLGNGRAPLRVTAVAGARIEALTFHRLDLDPAPIPIDGPSALALKRQAQALSERLAGRLGTPLSIELTEVDDADRRRHLAAALVTLEAVLLEASADALGRRALGERVRTITLGTGDALEVALAEGDCHLVVGPGGPEFEALRARLYAQL